VARVALDAPVRWATLLLLVGVISSGGCHYNVGNSFPADVQTVYVPIFTNEDFRRGVEFPLTEAVQKQIQQRSHFRLVKDNSADTKLTGKITRIRKNVLGESRGDDPRELQLHYAIDVTWEDLRTGRLLAQQQVAIEPEVTHLISTASFAPEVGQSLATATQQACDQMARQIVDMMQTPW
jgi:hypothetical protein